MRHGVYRIEFNRARQVRHRRGQVRFRNEGGAPNQVSVRQVRLLAQRLVTIGERFVETPKLGEYLGTIRQRDRQSGIDPQRGAIILERGFELFLRGAKSPTRMESRRMVRIPAEGLRKVL